MKTKANIEKLFELIVKTTFFIEKKRKKMCKNYSFSINQV